MKKFLSLFYTVLFIFSLGYPFGIVTYAEEKTVSLENTPIDVVYCYADLWDHTLRRGELDNSIQKDYDNQELKYSLRSVLKNIPWVRKIFIIMPNDKVRFLKEPEEIKDKIVYVKNEDVCGFDTNSVFVKYYSMWKLKEKYGCSNHIIYLDDDFFIGKPLKKSDFFYIENNKVVPYVFSQINKPCCQTLKDAKSQRENIINHHNYISGVFMGWKTQVYSPYIFLMEDVFKQDSINLPEPAHMWHYALGINLDELQEIHGYLQNSSYAKDNIYAKHRTARGFLLQPTYLAYIFNKYNRKVRYPSHRFIPIQDCLKANFDEDLFVINTGGGGKESVWEFCDYQNARNTMKRLFPEPTPYEKPNCKLDILDFFEETQSKPEAELKAALAQTTMSSSSPEKKVAPTKKAAPTRRKAVQHPRKFAISRA